MKEETAPQSKGPQSLPDLRRIQVGLLLNGRYKVLAFLGEGGMGIAYKAMDTEVNRIVALKFLLAHRLGNTKDISRFEREAKTVSRLVHPGIAKLFDFVADIDQPFLVMEFLEGKTLAQRIATEGQLPLQETLDIFIQVCEALAYAHGNGILHRDIKPSNVMVTHDGETLRAKLLDFGTARHMSTEEIVSQQITETGEIVGSPLYMSPEQARDAALDARSDLYSLGCTLYEALTGSPPHVGLTSIATLLKRETDEPLALSEASLGRHFSDLLEQLVARLLKTNPDDRFQSADAVMQELIRIKSQGFTATNDQKEPPKAIRPLKNIQSRHYIYLLSISLAILLLLAGTLFLANIHEAKPPEKHAAEKQINTALPAPSDQESSIAVARMHAADLVARAELLRSAGRFREALPIYKDAVEIYERDPEPPSDRYGDALAGMAHCYMCLGESSESVQCANRAMDIFKKMHGEMSSLFAFHLTFVGCILLSAKNVEAKQAYQITKPYLERSISIATKIHRPGNVDLADYLAIQGENLLKRDLLDEALWRLEKSRILFRTSPQQTRESVHFPFGLKSLVTLYGQTRQYDKIPSVCQEMTSVYRTSSELMRTKYADSLVSTADLVKTYSFKTKNPLDSFRVAEQAYKAVIPVYRALPDTRREPLADLYEKLGLLCCEEASVGNTEGLKSAEHWFMDAIDVRKALPNPETIALARVIRALGTVTTAQHRYSDGRLLIDQALQLCKKTAGANSYDFAITLCCSAELYRMQGELPKAEPLYTQAMKICRQTGQLDSNEVAVIYTGLAACELKYGHLAEAIPLFEKSRKLYLKRMSPRSVSVVDIEKELTRLKAKLRDTKASSHG